MRVRSSIAVAAIAALAACTDSPVEPTQIKAVSVSTSHILASGLAPHEIAPPMYARPSKIGPNGLPLSESSKMSAGISTAATSPDIRYWGGGVIHEQKVAAIYYSPNRVYSNGPKPGSAGDGNEDRSLVGYFLNNLGPSSYWNINSTYYDKAGGRKRFVQNSMEYDAFWAPRVKELDPGTIVSDDDMIYLIETAFANRKLKYDPNTLYVVFTGPGINLGGGFSHTELDYCAYHSGYWFPGGPIVQYAAMPYDADFNPANPFLVTNPDGTVDGYVCTYLTRGPNDDLGADATVSAMAHEIEENATDPVSSRNYPWFLGWYTKYVFPNGIAYFEENGDKCAYTYGYEPNAPPKNRLDYWNLRIGEKQFLVQQNWSNLAPQGCLTGLRSERGNGGEGSGRQ